MRVDDMELVRDYAVRQSEPAFETLVSRHVDLVYSAALRQMNNPQVAEEVAQAVFIILARKAGRLGPGTILPGWLYHTTRYVCADVLKIERRRRKREQEAYMQSTLIDDPDRNWEQLAPLLDEAMANLGEKDRNAVVLRFFGGKSMQDVGVAMSASEEATKKRVQRAVDKLRLFFMKRGVALSSTVISGALSHHAVHAAPTTMMASVVAAAKGSAATSTFGLAKGVLKFMAWTKLKTVAAAGGVVLLAAAGTTVVIVKSRGPSAEEVMRHLGEPGYLEKAPAVVLFRPTRYPGLPERFVGFPGPSGRIAARARDFAWDFALAYDINPDRLVLPAEGWPARRFDVMTTIPKDPKAGLREAIRKQLGLVAHREIRELDALVLKTGPRTAASLPPGGTPLDGFPAIDAGHLQLENITMDDLSCRLSFHYLGMPIIDETGLGGQRYNVNLRWNPRVQGAAQKAEIERALREQLGLETSWERRPVEMLVVEHVAK